MQRLEVRDPSRVGVVTQTTLSVDDTADVLDALKRRFPTLATPRKEDICYATQNRQDAVKKLVARLRRGDRGRLADRARIRTACARSPRRRASRATSWTGPTTCEREWFEGKPRVGVTAGASAPELLVQRVVGRLREWGGEDAEEVVGRAENVVFALPRELRHRACAGLVNRRRPRRRTAASRSRTPRRSRRSVRHGGTPASGAGEAERAAAVVPSLGGRRRSRCGGGPGRRVREETVEHVASRSGDGVEPERRGAQDDSRTRRGRRTVALQLAWNFLGRRECEQCRTGIGPARARQLPR